MPTRIEQVVIIEVAHTVNFGFLVLEMDKGLYSLGMNFEGIDKFLEFLFLGIKNNCHEHE